MLTLASFALFLPLLGAFIAGFGQRLIGLRTAQLVASLLVCLAALLALRVFFAIGFGSAPDAGWSLPWIRVGQFVASWGLWLDTLTAVMLLVVLSVSAVVHLYAIGYMKGDAGGARFHAYLSLFTFAMLMLVTSDNLLQLFFGWEGVGLCSYLLIGFWYHKESANAAAIKAFVVNRVGDFGFALGIIALFWFTGTIKFDALFEVAPLVQDKRASFLGLEFDALTLATMLLFIGAMGKSAQLFLHTWLPDAMEGPTPVSALIHAATMVTAGVFLVARLSPLFELAPFTLHFITLVGATTALFAATVGLTQFDIKRVIAYSTCSQLGYMMFAAGVGAFGGAIFHLLTHAFFKALLFLGAGAVIHAMHHEQDMRNMGGLARKLPWTHGFMLLGSLALAGVGIPQLLGPGGIGLAGFHSKDLILEAAWLAHTPIGNYAFWLGILVALMTAFYSFRLLFLTFYGHARGDAKLHKTAHEAPGIMRWPLLLLALGAVITGFLLAPHMAKHGTTANQFWAGAVADFPLPTQDAAADYPAQAAGVRGTSDSAAGHADAYDGDTHLGDSYQEGSAAQAQAGDSTEASAGYGDSHAADYAGHAEHPPTWVLWLPLLAALSGIALAGLVYGGNRDWGPRIARTFAPLNRFFANKWYFDEAYELIFLRPARGLGQFFWKIGDIRLIDGFGPNGLRDLARLAAAQLSRAQSGYVYHYAFVMIAGILVLTTLFWLTLGRG